MAKIGRICKEYMIKELSKKLKGNSNIFVTDCTGLNVSDLARLRASLKTIKVSYIIVKNSLGKIALKNVSAEPLISLLEGTIGLTLGGTDPISISKALLKFSKDSGKLKVRGGVVEGKIVSEQEVKELSLLVSREILLARAFGGMKAPISGFVNVLEGTVTKFVYAINAIKTKKEGGTN